MPEKTRKQIKEVHTFEKEVDVNGLSTLKVQVAMNTKNATYKVSGFITTNQVDTENPTAIINQLDSLLEEALKFANDRRLDILQAMRKAENPGQTELFDGEPAPQ